MDIIKAANVMQKVVSIPISATIKQAINVVVDNNTFGIPVIDQRRNYVGIVTKKT